MTDHACPLEGARPASEADRADIVELIDEAARMVADARGGDALVSRDHPSAEIGSVLDDALDGHPEALALVGTLDDMVVGNLLARNTPDSAGRSVVTIVSLWVTPEARGVGVGEALIELLVARAEDAGCVAIDADALPGDRDTKNFFEANGLVARGIRVSRRLTD